MRNLKSRRGFSLVELMVVVAIMGTLAAIAIPAYNEYRKSAKKTAYRSDLLGLHKGWLAFGVELDSFCERDTVPKVSGIRTVGMQSLTSSKLYGPTTASAADCDSTVYGATCTGCTVSGTSCTGTTASCTNSAHDGQTCGLTAYVPADSGNGPGKENFIGFGTQTGTNCTNANIAARQIKHNSSTHNDTACNLTTITYTMGVAGHLSGKDYIGININNNGVVDENSAAASSVIFVNNGICG